MNDLIDRAILLSIPGVEEKPVTHRKTIDMKGDTHMKPYTVTLVHKYDLTTEANSPEEARAKVIRELMATEDPFGHEPFAFDAVKVTELRHVDCEDCKHHNNSCTGACEGTAPFTCRAYRDQSPQVKLV